MNLSKILLLILVILLPFLSNAQPILPDVGIMTQGGINILSWNNPTYQNSKTVLVQRSKDSVMNFVTIGKVLDISRSSQFYTDATATAGDNYYRVKIVYEAGFEWTSNTVKIYLDTADVEHRKVLPSNDSLQVLLARMSNGTTPNVSQIDNMGYTPSRYVFSNPFSGHINIELSNTIMDKYVIHFFNQDKKILEIPRVNEDIVILDKRNFQTKGIYNFTIWKNGKEFEKGVVSIY